jgi:lipopolysaccharide export system permease protein
MTSIISRYVSREFMKLFALCLSSLILVYLVFDFIDRAGSMFRETPKMIHVILYFVYKIPTIIFQLVPVSTLLAALLLLAIMSRNSEVTAMKAGGVSVARIAAPLLAWACLLAVGAFLINEFIVPGATTKMKYIMTVYIQKHDWRTNMKARNLWYKSPNAFYHIANFRPEVGRLDSVQIYRVDEQFNLTERFDAERAEWIGGRWIGFNGWRRTFRDDGRLATETRIDQLPLPIPETPDELKVYKKDPEQMSFREMRGYIRELRSEGYDVRRYEVDLQSKIGFALVTVIMALLGMPWAVGSGRQGGVAFGIAVAVFIGVVYWIVMGFCQALGRSSTLPVFVAAWGPHMLFGALGVVGILRVRS